MGRYFGTDGFRGEANVQLTAAHAYQTGRYIGWHFGRDRRARIVIGMDTRKSGDMLAHALAAGISASGADAYLLQVTTTPCVAYMVRVQPFDCGVMISASHNPYYDNGIKLIGADGRKISADIEEQIEHYIDTGLPEIPLARRDAIGVTRDFPEGREAYAQYLISAAPRPLQGMKVALDCANGSTFALAGQVFGALGAETVVLFNDPDGVNINDGCGSTHTEELQRYVAEHHLDAGFAYDGDGDRCLAVDENGDLVDGDRIMYICAKALREEGALDGNTLVTTVMSNLGLYKALEQAGIRSEKTAVGDKYVAECMFANGYQLGGEQSGHIIFGRYATTGDGILTSLMLAAAVRKKQTTLSALAAEVTIYPQLLQNVRVTDKNEATENPNVLAVTREVQKQLGDDGRVLVRQSGTEPLIRVMVEAKTDEICAQCVGQIVDVMEKEGLLSE